MSDTYIKVDGDRYRVEEAKTLIQKAWGLSMREKGKMLFVFEKPQKPTFDMMLVQHPLHMYFIDSQQEVKDCVKAEPWTLDPRTWKLYRPERPVKYVLESFEDLDLQQGDKIQMLSH